MELTNDKPIVPLNSELTPSEDIWQKESERLLKDIERVEADVAKVSQLDIREVEQTAVRYAGLHSQVLAAIAGGVIGGTTGLGLGVAGITLGGLGTIAIISGPAGMALGIALALLSWRGREYFIREKEIQLRALEIDVTKQALTELRRRLDEIQETITRLPKDTPPAIKGELWRGYRRVSEKYIQVSLSDLADGQMTESPENNVVDTKYSVVEATSDISST